MAEEEKKYLPMTTAGIVGYREESESKIKLKPEHVLFVIGILVAIELALSLMLK